MVGAMSRITTYAQRKAPASDRRLASCWSHAALVGALLLGGQAAFAPHLAAQPAPDPAPLLERKAQTEHRLDTLNSELRASSEDLTRLASEIESTKRDRADLNRRLIETAANIKTLEGKLSATEQRLADLDNQQGRLNASLAARRDTIATLLASLQRLGRNPPPAMVVEPESALKAVRSAILFGAVLPEIKGEADALAADLEELARVRGETRMALDAIKGEMTALAENRLRIEMLAEQKKKNLAANEEDARATRQRSEALAKDAKTLRELILRTEGEITAAQRAAEEAAKAEAQRAAEIAKAAELARKHEQEQREKDEQARARGTIPDPAGAPAQTSGTGQMASLPARPAPNPSLGPAGRLAPNISFDRAKGLLPLPVSGDLVRRYGESEKAGGTARGISLATRPQAQVTAPADGWVVFAGPFRAYGQMVIVNAGGGYHILLAGVERITVEVGQFVLAGEPIALMGARTLATATAVDMGIEKPVLYVEFRKDGNVIDPMPWWSGKMEEKARG